MRWIEVMSPAPILNTPNFSLVFGGKTGAEIPLDTKFNPYYYEYVALKKMQFEVVEETSLNILMIKCPNYSSLPLFIDKRFCKPILHPSFIQPVKLTAEIILNFMEDAIGTPYIWGGNYAKGVPEMLNYYPPKYTLDPKIQDLWTFRGLDCSGLLYEASKGSTPRNTSHLLKYGRSLNSQELFQPLDMIIHPGHVLFIRNHDTIIESKSPFGVRIYSLEKRWNELLQERKFIREWEETANLSPHFTIRRFI